MPRELHWTIGSHDEMDEPVMCCDVCGDSNGDICSCYYTDDNWGYEDRD